MGTTYSTDGPIIVGLTSSTKFGQGCVFSEPFDAHATAEEFFEAVLQWLQSAKTPIDGSAPKRVQIVDVIEGHEFTTVATWDGDLARQNEAQHNLENVPSYGDYIVQTRVVYDRSNLSIRETKFVGSHGNLMLCMNATAVVHRTPARLEWTAIDRRGLRPSFFVSAALLQQVINDIFGIVALQTTNTLQMALSPVPGKMGLIR